MQTSDDLVTRQLGIAHRQLCPVPVGYCKKTQMNTDGGSIDHRVEKDFLWEIKTSYRCV